MKPLMINGRYRYILPDHIAEWDALSMWERERTESMEAHLNGGMVLYDIGAEHGAQSAVYSGFCGPENMVLIEPSCSFWSNIALIWQHNNLHTPLACVHGFVSDKTVIRDFSGMSCVERGWPGCADTSMEAPARRYNYLHDRQGEVDQWRIDSLVPKIGVPPDAITMDIEGAEYLAVRGAFATLKIYRPLVWISIHPNLMERDYGHTPQMLHLFMSGAGYVGRHLITDHEEHWLFLPEEHPHA